jgi:hypothetical protein
VEERQQSRRKNYRRLRNESKRATDKARNEYLQSICEGITEFQKRERYDLMYMKTKELRWKDNSVFRLLDLKALE